jgi:MFS family permease
VTIRRVTEGGRRLFPPLGARAWRLLGGVLLFEIGTGMTLPLVIVYLHQQRGISLAASGLALAAGGAGGLVATLAAGPAVDRVGAGRIALGGLTLAGAGTAAYLAVHAAPGAVAASAAQGAGFGATWVALFPLLIGAVEPSLRGDVLGASYGVTNLGLGIGSLVAGLVLIADPGGFAPLFAADAATYAVFALWLIWTGEIRRGRPAGGDDHVRGGYRAVVRNRALLIATGLNLVLVTAGYSQFMAAFPAWATGDAGAPRSLVGFAFAANTWTIAVAQLPMLTVARSQRRTRLVAWTGLLFGACWLVVLAAGETSTTWLAYSLLLGAPAVFGLGETLLSPSLPAIVNDLATDETRGRFVAVYSMGWQIGPMIGPAVAGVALGAGQGPGLLIGLAVACALVAPAAIAYERVLPPAANRADATAGDGVRAGSTERALI